MVDNALFHGYSRKPAEVLDSVQIEKSETLNSNRMQPWRSMYYAANERIVEFTLTVIPTAVDPTKKYSTNG